jgi:8-oxo-dGTP pyrophosphatase MutT (NUDIX family)
MSAPRRSRGRPGKPVWQRGRLGRFGGGVWDYVRTAWWGLVSARVIERRPLVLAQAVILRDAPRRQVLLSVRSDLFGWELPGGTLAPGETDTQALVREVHEETGLEVACLHHVGDWVRRGFRPHVAHVHLCRVTGGEIIPSHETPRVAWFDVDALPEALFPWYHEPLERALGSQSRDPFAGDDWQGIATIWQAMKIDLAMRWNGLPPEIES